MMTIKQRWCFTFAVLLSAASFGQTDTLTLLVKLPPLYNNPGASLAVSIGGKTSYYALGVDSLHRLKIPVTPDRKTLKLTYSFVGYQPVSWNKDVHFTGADTALINFRKKDGGGHNIRFDMHVLQYPLIEFESAGTTHEVEVDGDPIGPTNTNKTVTPDENHNLVWKKGNTVTCSKTVKLKSNQSKKYRCNADGSLTEL